MFQKYTTGERTTLHNLESVKVTTQKVGQCKMLPVISSKQSANKSKVSVQSYHGAQKWNSKAWLGSAPRRDIIKLRSRHLFFNELS